MSVIPGMAGFGAALSKGVEPQLAASGLAGGSVFAKAFAPVAIVAALAAVGVATTKLAANYQEATTLLVTGAGESVANIGMIRDGLLAMAPAVGMGPEALAKAMFLVESAGFHGAAGLTVMNAAAQGAKIGGADATVVADGLTTAMTDYHYSADQANAVTSKLVQTVALGKTNMGDLSGALSHVLPFAANLKISFNDVMGAMATMTSQGIDAANAATMLKFGMSSLSNETPKGRDALTAIGLSAQKVYTDLGTKGLGGTLNEITDAIGKKFPAGSALAQKALSDIVGGTRGMGVALALTGANASTMTANVASIAGAVTEADGSVKGWALTQEDLNTQLDQAGAFFSSVGIKLGTVLIPAVTRGIQGFRDFAGEFENGTGTGGKFKDILTAIHDRAIVPIATFLTGTAVPAVQSFVQGFKDGTGIGGGFKDFLVLLYDDAVKPIGDFITKTAVPAIKDFVQGFKDGKGPGGDFRDILKKVYDDGIHPLATFITDTALPALKSIETWIVDKGIPALSNLKGWFEDEKGPLEALATFITITMLPVFAVMAANAVMSAVTQVGAWVSTQAAGVESALLQYGASVSIVTGWVIQAEGAIINAAKIVVAWVSTKAEAAASALASIGSMITMDIQWVTSAQVATAEAAQIDVAMTGIETSFGGLATASGVASTAVNSSFATMGGGIIGTIGKVLGGLASFALGVWVLVDQWDHIKQSWFTVCDGIKSAWHSVQDTINSWDIVKSLPTDLEVIAWYNRLGDSFYNAGMYCIGGLIKGFRAAAGGVVSWVQGFGQSLVSAFNQAVGNHSPSKVFATSGANIMKGLIVGLDSMQPQLDARMGSLVTTPSIASPDFTAGAANGSASAGAGNAATGALDLSEASLQRLAQLLGLASSSAVSTAQASRTSALARGSR